MYKLFYDFNSGNFSARDEVRLELKQTCCVTTGKLAKLLICLRNKTRKARTSEL